MKHPEIRPQAYYEALPLNILSTELADTVATPARISFAHLLVDQFYRVKGLVDSGNLKNKSAVRNCVATGKLLRQYENQGGRL